MGRRTLLEKAPPRLEQHMIDQDRPLTANEVEELTGLSKGSTYIVLTYMMAVKKVDRVKIGGRYRYFLKGAFDKSELEAREEAKRRKPRIPLRRREASRVKRARGWRREKDPLEEYRERLRAMARSGEGPSGLAILGLSRQEQDVSKNDGSIEVGVSSDEQFLDTGEAEVDPVEEDLIIIKEQFGQVRDLPKEARLLTIGDTKYLKEHHLSKFLGYEGIERFSSFFVESSALERREYGNVFYASMGTNPWEMIHKVVVAQVVKREAEAYGR